MKRKPVDFKSSKRIIDSGTIINELDLKIHVFLCHDGTIQASTDFSDYELFLKAVVLFFEDVFNNIRKRGDFVSYGIGEYPVSYEKIGVISSRCKGYSFFEERLSILKKDYYDLMLEYINETE